LEGAVAVVTGAGRGLGYTIAEELGFGGAKVVVNYARSRELAEELAAKLSENGEDQAVAIGADVSDPGQAQQLIEETVGRYGRIDVLVNNAGIVIDRSMKKLTPKSGTRSCRWT
jgi:NAD(P)-dependent dehydrogenase (short-subunit alcohol dehydrogenase family)